MSIIQKEFNESNRLTLFNGDCSELLKSIPSNSVDLIITSPPYCIRKAYENPHDDIKTFKKQHEDIFDDLYRVLKTGGSICWQVGYHVSDQCVIPLDYVVYNIFTSRSARIFAHYEAPATEKYELQIAPLRKQLHFLVASLIFPTEMKEAERKQIQSQIFLDVNDNTKKVAPNVLTHIEMVKDPFSDIGLARRVIERLNKKRVFLNRFELSALDESKIKVAPIIKFALRYLVTVTPAEGKTRELLHFLAS